MTESKPKSPLEIFFSALGIKTDTEVLEKSFAAFLHGLRQVLEKHQDTVLRLGRSATQYEATPQSVKGERNRQIVRALGELFEQELLPQIEALEQDLQDKKSELLATQSELLATKSGLLAEIKHVVTGREPTRKSKAAQWRSKRDELVFEGRGYTLKDFCTRYAPEKRIRPLPAWHDWPGWSKAYLSGPRWRSLISKDRSRVKARTQKQIH